MFSEFGHRSEAETGCKAVARRPSGTKPATDAAHWIRRVTLVITRPSLPRLARPLDVASLLQFITGARTFFRVFGVAVGISTSLSSGHAEVEEYDGHNESLFIYAGSAFTGALVITLASDNNTTIISQPGKQYELYDTLYRDSNFNASMPTQRDRSSRPTHLDGISDDLIPSTVWGLEVSNGVRFAPNYNDLMRTIGGDSTEVLAVNTDVGGIDSLFQRIIASFRGANCDAELFERHGSKHCDVIDHVTDILDINTQTATGNDNNDRSTALNDEGDYYPGASNPIPAPIDTTQRTLASVQGLSAQSNSLDTVTDLSALVGSGINTFALQGRLMDRSPVTDPSALVGVGINTFALQGRSPAWDRCYDDNVVDVDFDVSASCRTSPITDEFQIQHGFSEPFRVSLPIITRLPVASAVPEIPTWIMFIIGFVIITLVRWKSKLNYEGRYRVFVKLANKVFLNH